MTQSPTPETPPGSRRDPLIERLILRARAALVWERLWRAMAPALGILGLFLLVSFLGLWQITPRFGRMAGVGAFVLAFIISLWSIKRFRWPSRAEALARVDEASGLAHRPAAVLSDAPANAGDPLTRALWAAHRRRAEALRARMRAGWPHPLLIARDPLALRAALVIAIVAAAFVAGPERYARFAAAFNWRGGGAAEASRRIDAWIDPPPYTGRAPILLDLTATLFSSPPKIEAPIGSTLIVRAPGGGVEVKVEGGLAPVETAKTAARADGEQTPPPPVRPDETRLKLTGDARATIGGGATRAAIEIAAIPDKPPVIVHREPPQRNHRGSLTLFYKLEDDYGVAAAEAVFANPGLEGQPAARRPLGVPPRAALALGANPGGLGEAQSIVDLADHPWGGAEVDLTLIARDEGGNEGRSETIRLVAPQRAFQKPLARALVEQRRKLVLAPDEKARVVAALEALLIAPDRFETGAGVYLGLRSIARRLTRARSNADLLDAADLMWEMALRLEDGDLSDAERDLRAAQQALREALQRGAPPEEIAKLTQDLRAAMDKFLRELAEQQARDSQTGDQQKPDRAQRRNSRSVTPEQLAKMIEELEQRARSGDRAEAQKALDDLQNLLDNLRTGKKKPPSEAARDMNQALDELDRMARDQQELRDETYAKGQEEERQARSDRRKQPNRRPPADDDEDEGDDGAGPNGEKPRAGGQANRQDLQKRQNDLRNQLDATRRKLRKHGQDGDKTLEEAEGAMQEAEKQIGRGQQGQDRAVDAQGRAAQALRKGAQALADKMKGQGEGDEDGGEGEGEQANGDDPLGREPGNGRRDNGRAKYDPLGQPAAQRAQRVLEELRRRLSEPGRPRDEVDYLERLLKRY